MGRLELTLLRIILVVAACATLAGCPPTSLLTLVGQEVAQAKGGTVATPQFDLTNRIYTADQHVTIADATDGCTIYYTTDGTTPTASSPVYSTPVAILGNGTTMTIKAFATKQWLSDSAVAAATFTVSYPISSVAGNGKAGFAGDGGLATSARLSSPQAVAVGLYGDLYIADTGNSLIRKVDTAGHISTVAGNTTWAGYSGDGGAAVGAYLNNPAGVAVDGYGNIYIADQLNNRIRKVDALGTITTVAGNGSAGYTGDGGPATGATLRWPAGISVDWQGFLYIADSGNHAIRRVDPSGTISTVAGTGTSGFSGDDGAATLARLSQPEDVSTDGYGTFFIADYLNNRIRQVLGGTITTLTGGTTLGYTGDGGPAVSATVDFPMGVAALGSGALLIADTSNNVIRRIDAGGTMVTIAGTGSAGYWGDGSAAVSAQLSRPEGVAVGPSGEIYIADTGNNVVRVVR